jgi:transcriptional regulator
MYIPDPNRVDDPAVIRAFIETHGFVTLVTQKDGIPCASHLPVLLDEGGGSQGELRGHMARANDQWRHFRPDQEVLCIFHGPHAYVSPSWYASRVAVATWDYATVHVYGVPRVIEDPTALRKIVVDVTTKYESKIGSPTRLQDDLVTSMLKATVGFSIRITRIEAKFKLGQNRTKKDQEAMLSALATAEDPDSRALAEFIRTQKV